MTKKKRPGARTNTRHRAKQKTAGDTESSETRGANLRTRQGRTSRRAKA